MTFLLATLLAISFPTSTTARQGTSRDGGVAWAVECTNCSGSGGTTNITGSGTIDGGNVGVSSLPLVFVGDAGVLNVNPVAIFSMPFVFVADAGVLNINLPSGAATSSLQSTGNTSLANLDVALSTRTKPADQQHVIIDTAASTPVTGTFWQVTQPVSATALPLPAGAATDATLSQLLDGGVGLLSTIAANQTSGNEQVQIMLNRYPLNPFLPRCNPVRRTGCQP